MKESQEVAGRDWWRTRSAAERRQRFRNMGTTRFILSDKQSKLPICGNGGIVTATLMYLISIAPATSWGAQPPPAVQLQVVIILELQDQ
jgi:hypothetical protein